MTGRTNRERQPLSVVARTSNRRLIGAKTSRRSAPESEQMPVLLVVREHPARLGNAAWNDSAISLFRPMSSVYVLSQLATSSYK